MEFLFRTVFASIFFLSYSFDSRINAQTTPAPGVNLPQCPNYEHWNDCGSAQYEIVCGSNNFSLASTPSPSGENGQCSAGSGCTCDSGLQRGPKGLCYDVSSCPECPTNQTFVRCPRCIRTCSQGPPVCNLPKCSWPYPDGKCECLPGYIFGPYGNCISVSDCTECPANEQYNDCTSSCEPTCETPNPSCTGCNPGKCECRSGFVRSLNGTCVTLDNCPPCPRNESFVRCQPCEWKCSDRTAFVCGNASPRVPRNGFCQCSPGYFRNGNQGPCVQGEDCPPPTAPTCQQNEILSSNIPCDKKCNESAPIACMNIPNVMGKQVCVCRDGYSRDPEDRCVLQDDCPVITLTCDQNEENSNNCSVCERLCQSPDELSCRATLTPCDKFRACQCASGFFRNGTSGNCVSRKQCPQQAPAVQCSVNETLALQGCPPCDRRCGQKTGICSMTPCNPNGCKCREGFVRAAGTDAPCINEALDCVCRPECQAQETCVFGPKGPICQYVPPETTATAQPISSNIESPPSSSGEIPVPPGAPPAPSQ